MDEVIGLLNHLLTTRYSIDTVDSITNHLNISKSRLYNILNERFYEDYFQLLRPFHKGKEKIALTLDLFYCTHYPQRCQIQSCSFIHLCPYTVKPFYTKCTNKTCTNDHDIMKNSHNRKIIDARGLSFIPTSILYELIRASANPTRSFWICNDYGKKDGCTKYCDKLHYCYYFLTNSCTKRNCYHGINNDCISYFKDKQLNELNYEDVLSAFRKVLRQRKSDYIAAENTSLHSSPPSASPKNFNFNNQERKSTRTFAYDEPSSPDSDIVPILPENERDIILLDCHDMKNDRKDENYLSDAIGCPIKLLISKDILSKNKEKLDVNQDLKSTYYFCPTKTSNEIFQLLCWQNEKPSMVKPLIIYSSIRDAHNAAEQNHENNQFCLIRLRLFYSTAINGNLLSENRLRLSDPSTMYFDHMWVYVYNL